MNDFSDNDSESRPDESARITIPEDIPKDGGVTTFRVRFRKHVEAIFTPLLIPAIACFEEDIKNIVSIFFATFF